VLYYHRLNREVTSFSHYEDASKKVYKRRFLYVCVYVDNPMLESQ